MRRLEARYPTELAVVGVHSGKYWAERVTANIRQAVLRLDVDHPVVNDRLFRIWRRYGVNAWPTLVLVDPAGREVGSHAGEATAEALDPIVARLVRDADARGILDRRPLDFLKPERLAEPERPLAFPGKVLATADGRLFVADSGHNRVLIVSLEPDGRAGRVEQVVGSGLAGLGDGDFEGASFHHPQGLALAGTTLYVADAGNHAVRAVDLPARRVTTIAGTGEQDRSYGASGPGRLVPLSSPWDLAVVGGSLYVAMAGTHQLYRLDLSTGEIQPYAGTGREALADGSLGSADLAQPMGLTTDGRRLYFADAESNAVRWADLPSQGGRVGTIVGTGLFDFGDLDGTGDLARLQHDQGIAWAAGRLYVADTYNGKVKVVDPATREATTLLASGGAEASGGGEGSEAGYRDGEASLFYEPGGLSVVGDRLYVTDTNNHAIRVADLATSSVATVTLVF